MTEPLQQIIEALEEIAEMRVYSPEGGHEEVLECNRIARAALALARSMKQGDGWRFPDQHGVPEVGTECIVLVRSKYVKGGPFMAVDTWKELHEAPVGFSSATVPVGPGWSEFDYEDVIAWQKAPAHPAPSSIGERA